MNIVITIVAVLTGILLLLLIAALFIPKHYAVVVSETIATPFAPVINYVSILKNQIHYSEWLRADPELNIVVAGRDGYPGAVLKWESHNKDKNKNVGTSEQEIIKLTNDYLEIQLRIIKPQSAVCKLENHFIAINGTATLYTCTFHAYARYPINLPAYVIGRHFIKKAQQKTLRNLKMILEARSE